MKKIIAIACMVWLYMAGALADNISVEDITLNAGEATTVNISLTNTESNLVSFQMDLSLPAGISINKAGCSLSSRFGDPDQVLTIGKQGDNVFRLTSTSFALTPISGTSGTLITLSLTAAEGSEGGTATLSDILFVTDGSVGVAMDNVTFSISIPLEQTLTLETLPTMTYGDADYTLPESTEEGQTLTWSSSNTAVATISGHVLAINGAGTTTITASQSGNSDYKPFSREFTLTVGKAALTITANDQTKVEGEENPELTVSYEGFQYDDDESVLTQQPTVTTTATADSPAGTYPITPSGAEAANYDISYVDGTLTVEAAQIEDTDISQLDNAIYIENTEVKTGGQAVLSIKMKNETPIRGFQFDLYLPEGVTAAKTSKGKIIASLSSGRLEEDDEHTLTTLEQSNGAIRFLCSSLYDENFTGNDGEILTLTVNVAENMEDGDYPLVIRDARLTETDISQYYMIDYVKSTLTVSSYMLGDINADGEVDVRDYTGVANHIMGNTPAGFVFKAGDVDESGDIDVRDYTGVANIILTGSIYGSTSAKAMNVQGMAKTASATDISGMDNVAYVADLTAEPGSQVNLSIRMKNTAPIRAFQFDLYLPDGVTAAKTSKGKIIASLSSERLAEDDEHTLTTLEQSDGAIRFLCGSLYDEIFTGNDGEVATLTVNISENIADGDYSVLLKNIILTETDISRSYESDNIEGVLTIGTNDGRVHLSETSTTMPEAQENVNVTVERTIKAGQWSTICLPFPIAAEQMTTAFGEEVEVQLADFTGYVPEEDEAGDIVAIKVSFSTVTQMEANHPYIIKVNKDVTEIKVDNVDVNPVESPTNATITRTRRQWSEMIGTYVAEFTVPEQTLFLSGNKFYYSVGLTKMKAFRAYFDFYDLLTSVENADSKFSMNFDPTGIDGLPLNVIIKGAVYTVGGQLVGKDVDERQLPRGVYIRDGKKFVIK